MPMAPELVEAMQSLAMLMEEENTALEQVGRLEHLQTLVAAKLRLVSNVEAMLARANREQPDWIEQLDEEERQEFRAMVESLMKIAQQNGTILQRQIDVSNDLIDAIATEARRLNGSRSMTYTARGGLARSDGVAPIAVDSGF